MRTDFPSRSFERHGVGMNVEVPAAGGDGIVERSAAADVVLAKNVRAKDAASLRTPM
jgi:hypothetical protein